MSETTTLKTALAEASKLPQTQQIDLILTLLKSLPSTGRAFIEKEIQLKSLAAQAESNPVSDPAYSVAKAAKMLGASTSSVSKWFDTGKLRGYRSCSTLVARIEHESLVKFLAENNLEAKIPSALDGESPTYSTTKASDILGVTTKTILRWVKSGKLKAYFIPGNQERKIWLSGLVKFAEETDRQLKKAA